MPQRRIPTDIEGLLEHQNYVRELARRLVRDEHRAHDLAQDTLAAALESPPARVNGPHSLRIWLARVLRNLAATFSHREAARTGMESLGARPERVDWNGAEELDGEEQDFEQQQLLIDALRGLRQPYRRAPWLRYMRELTPTQIAAREENSLATVKTRLRRGLELLREDLDRSHGGDRARWRLALLPLAFPTDRAPWPVGSSPAASLPQPVSITSIPLLTAGLIVALGSAALMISGLGEGEPGGPQVAVSPEYGRSREVGAEALSSGAAESTVSRSPKAASRAGHGALAAPALAGARLRLSYTALANLPATGVFCLAIPSAEEHADQTRWVWLAPG